MLAATPLHTNAGLPQLATPRVAAIRMLAAIFVATIA